MELDNLITSLVEPLKKYGYRKKNTTWYKVSDTLSIVFNIQKSQYGADVWYYNFGVGINELESKPITTISKCHIIERIDKTINGKELTLDVLLQAIHNWETEYGDINKLRIRAIENRLPKMATRKAISYLTSVKF